ncbi:preprotein translocase subunit YajC [Nocardia asteroides]|uniref:preprotein translocase subunit YajC n=1 Tax=Nocardia asteroides TaxID=1824 RepID=UPI001E47E53E|nr:preprotein translocase subunit YajC [Nocardia asteroides]UGT63300.1 preprotein translocase subunit YajC [Nocardia asteroides]
MELLFPLLLVALLVPMFLGVRRQKREAEKVSAMQNDLKIGDRVTTTSGLYGTVVEVDETTVDLEIAEEVVTTWLRQAVREVRTEDEVVAEEVVVTEEPGITAPAVADETEAAAPASAEETPAQTETRLTKD